MPAINFNFWSGDNDYEFTSDDRIICHRFQLQETLNIIVHVFYFHPPAIAGAHAVALGPACLA